MIMKEIQLKDFAEKIIDLPDRSKYLPSDLLSKEFLLEEEGNIQIYYAAHNEYINQDAKVLMIGITPGWVQMETKYNL